MGFISGIISLAINLLKLAYIIDLIEIFKRAILYICSIFELP